MDPTGIEQARAGAARRGHARMGAPHLVEALLATMEGRIACARLLVSEARLREKIDELHASLPAVLYRGGAPPELEPGVAARLSAVRARGLVRRFFATPGPQEYLDALLDDVCFERGALRFDVTPIARFHADAVAYAKRRAHRQVLVDHAFIVLLEQDLRLRGALRLVGLEPAGVRDKLAYRLGTRRYRSFKLQRLPNLVFAAAIHGNFAGRREITTEALVGGLLKHGAIQHTLAVANARPYEVYYAWVHGEPEGAIPLPSATRVDILIEDDSFSTHEEVVRLLVAVLGTNRTDAIRQATATTDEGNAVVAKGIERTEAERLLALLREARSERCVPLRVMARAGDDPRP